jgi:hypothetical protein
MTPETSPSIYPDFFKTGVGKLQSAGLTGNDLQGLFTALQYFQRDIKEQDTVPGLLQVAQLYLDGLDLFQASAFYLINPASFEFEPAWCLPESEAAAFKSLVQAEMRSGKFAWALRQSHPVFFTPKSETGNQQRGLFHSLSVSTHTIGMFCGLLKKERLLGQEVTFSLLSIILGNCSDALAVTRNTAELKNKILAANRDLQQALTDNEVLARIPAESPSPVIRINRNGQILYSNQPGLECLRHLGVQPGDFIVNDWQQVLNHAFETGEKGEFEAVFDQRTFTFVVAAIKEAGYANFYGTNITRRKQAEEARQRTIVELQDALQKVKTLTGLLPICASCKKIRNDQGYWDSVEGYVQAHTDAQFSHGICPDCLHKLYPEFADEVEASIRSKQKT